MEVVWRAAQARLGSLCSLGSARRQGDLHVSFTLHSRPNSNGMWVSAPRHLQFLGLSRHVALEQMIPASLASVSSSGKGTQACLLQRPLRECPQSTKL